MRASAKTAVQITNAKLRRRSHRLTLRIPLIAYSYSETNGKMRFHESTHTLKVNAYGGLIPLEARVGCGDRIMLKHPARPEEQSCKVVFVSAEGKAGRKLVGFEFTEPVGDFWHVYFPPLAAKPGAN